VDAAGDQALTRYVCDDARHLVCEPYSVSGLHEMARALGLGRHWFHGGRLAHYDIPVGRREEIEARCQRVGRRDIVRIIRGGAAHEATA